jgi:hypothetical protein
MPMPILVKDQQYKFFLGVFCIKYCVEDRYPNNPSQDDSYPTRYKHFIDVYVFGKRKLNWTFRTAFIYEDLPFKGQ